MSWKQFLKIGYPEALSIEESHRDIIFRSHRWLGLRFAYFFYQLRISARLVEISRIFFALSGLYFLSLIIQGNIWLSLLGVFLLYGQNILDYADGVVARATGKTTKLGAALDSITNSFSRAAILVLLGAFSGNIFFVVISIFSAFMLINFRGEVGAKISDGTIFRAVELFYRLILSIQFMLFVLPLLIVLTNILNWPIVIFSSIVVSFYTGLAIFWLLLCLWKKNY